MYRQTRKLETIYENSSDEEIFFESQSEPIASTSSNVAATSSTSFDGNRSAISSNRRRNITPKSSTFESNLETTRVVESERNAINPNLSLPISQELMTQRSPNLHNRPDLYSENDANKTKQPFSYFLQSAFHWIYPSTPLVIKLYRNISLRKFKKSVAKSCAIKIPKDCVIIWHRNLNCDGISVGEENNDKVVLQHLTKSGKVYEIKTDAVWKYFRSYWTDDVEVSIVKKELFE
ncbi:15905_t:CDS:2 [Gigaspora rosea]|nr:15905_t:CDS:2 [Gigaspora rosea]